MSAPLTVTNVLDQREALITITLLPGGLRAQRPIVVTVGVPDEQVAIRTGKFAQMTQLIDEAWNSYTELSVGGAPAPLPMPVPAEAEEELLDEEAVDAGADTTTVTTAPSAPSAVNNGGAVFYGDDDL